MFSWERFFLHKAVSFMCRSKGSLEFGFLRRISSKSNGDEFEKRPHEPLKLGQNPPLAIIYPKLGHYFRNIFFSSFIIRPYFDVHFKRSDFVLGARHAISVISHEMSQGKVDGKLQSLITPECMTELKSRLSNCSLAQKLALAVRNEDIYLSFIYQIGILFGDEKFMTPRAGDGTKNSRHVEITFVAHTSPNIKHVSADGISGVRAHLNRNGGPIILNYRFIRNYSKGIIDQWTVNAISHFYLKDEIAAGRD